MQGLCPLPRLRQTIICNNNRYPSAFFAWATPDPIFLSGQRPLLTNKKDDTPITCQLTKLKRYRLFLNFVRLCMKDTSIY